MTQSATLSAKAASLLSQGRRFFDAGLLADAVELLGRARAIAPLDLDCARWLAEAQLESGLLADASATLADARSIAPSASDIVVLQAEIALLRGSLLTAERLLDVAIETAGPDATLLAERGRVHAFAGEHQRAIDCLRRSLALEPRNLAAQSELIFASQYDPSITTARLKTLQKEWHGPQRVSGERREPEPGPSRLRVGYVSCAFNEHAAARVFSAVLLRHDPAKVEVFCYSSRRRRDWLTVRLRFVASQWRSIAGLDDAAAADLIRRDRIDILVDLDGHMRRNRLGIFGLRAAPVQVSAWGYVAGPGTPGIDYLLTDRVIAPAEEEGLFPERLVILPCAQPYDADLRAGAASSPPPSERGDAPVRFGCFNRYDKLSQEVLATWAEVLVACPSTTLTLKDRFFGEMAIRERVLAILTRSGVDPKRVLFEPHESHAGYVAAYDRIDVALDPFPVTGGVTSLDALSRGVPVVTLRGKAPPSRIGASILTYLGLKSLIAETRDDYVRMAVALGRDDAALTRLRGEVLAARVHFGEDALVGYARAVEAAYQEIWQATQIRP